MKQFNEFIKKNKNLSIIVSAVVILVVLGGVFFLVSKNKSTNSGANPTPAPTQEVINSINPSDLGITLTAGPANQTVILKVAKTEEVLSLDYQLSYMATVNGSQVSRGAIGHIDVKQKGSAVNQKIDLGTCSDVCHYDKGVSDIKLILKVNKTDGKTYQTNLTLSL